MKDFINYNQALELKELGFDEPCFGYYDLDGLQVNTHHWYPQNKNSSFPLPHTTNNPKISAPTFSQAFRFFRDKKLSDSCICRYQGRNDGGIYYYYVINHDFGIEETKHYKEGFLSYEEAESACLDKLIEIVKTK